MDPSGLVVAGGGEPRNGHLASQVRQLGLKVFIVESPLADQDDMGFAQVDQSHSRLLYGRELTAGEVACVIGHQRAMEYVVAQRLGSALVLEDDVSLDVSGSALQDLIAWVGQADSPTIVTLFPQGRIQTRRAPGAPLGLRRVIGIPPGAPAYVANQRVAQLCLKSPKVVSFRADWPGWAGQVRFFSTPLPWVELCPYESLVGQDRRSVSRPWRIKSQIGNCLGLPFLLHPKYYGYSPTSYARLALAGPIAFRWSKSRTQLGFRRR